MTTTTKAQAIATGTRRFLPWIAPLAVTAFVSAAYIWYSAWQWNQIAVKSWDLSIFTQLLQQYSQWQEPIVSVKGDGFNLLGDHFHPLLAMLTPVFAIFPHAFTLLVIQALCFGVAAGMFTAVATRVLHSRISGTLLGLAFGLSWGLQYAVEAQFHEIALAVPLLTGATGAIVEKRYRAAVLWAAPLVFVKEDLGLTVLMIGLVIAYLERTIRGLWLALWGVAWFAIAIFVVLPLLNPDGAWAYGSNASPGGFLANPDTWFADPKTHTVLLLLATTAGFLLRSPLTVIMFPTLAWRFLSTNEGYWGPDWHYSTVLMPIAFAVLLDGIQRAATSDRPLLRRYAKHGVAVAVTVAVMLLPQLPLADPLKPGAWERPQRADDAAAIIANIPAGASVETDIGIMSYLVDDHEVFWLGNKNPAPDCLVIDRARGGTPDEWGDVVAVAKHLHPGVEYTHVTTSGDMELACRLG
ncbi:DUF2079 domain-containing protein [Microbacterium sp. NC79]|uniref:DUF2079 domain-containing protein n=1 Tax=Microbacterium sp. NC79 TaxID=2851009 RepID=UPI001C2C8DD5|nr:DUF2079 domain-containing protein [Microbacterium sp. NC79]MBV0894248.1 DUF2079 domain-containing protein [Microbacterium sp. NC79]